MSLNQRWMCSLLLVLALDAVSFADEIVPIGKIVANASSFADHLVTFRGLVVSLDRIAGPSPRGGRVLTTCPFHDRYMALIEDETGSIPAMVCGFPLDDKGRVAQGDHVVIRAIIDVISGVGFQSDVVAIGVRMERAIEVDQ